MVAVTAGPRRRAWKSGWRVPVGRWAGGVAGAVAAGVGAALAALLAVRALLAFALIAYGAWLAWPPAGFITAGVLLLADRLLDERRSSDE